MQILPAIIPKDFEDLKNQLKQVEGLVDWVQVDIMDGAFTPPTTWSTPKDLETLNTKINIEAHLMISDPDKTIDQWLDSKVKRILVHYESTTKEKLLNLINLTHEANKEIGIALKLETPIEVLDEFIDKLDAVQLMSIAEIGYHGHPFDIRVIDKIKQLREKYPNVIISVDGGINIDNAKDLIDAGANNLAVGSSLFKGDIGKNIDRLKNII